MRDIHYRYTQMESEKQIDKKLVEEATGQFATVTRDRLYALVWAEPMLKVAAKFGVSSSYMTRVCKLMNVPRPERGYWAKLAVGKQPPVAGLPRARPVIRSSGTEPVSRSQLEGHCRDRRLWGRDANPPLRAGNSNAIH
jgi:hypothetical protein